MSKVTPFLMFDSGMEAAIEFHVSTFPDSRVIKMASTGKDGPMQSAEFVVGGQRFKAFAAGGGHFKFSEAFSMFVDCADQAEVDKYWDALLKVGAKPTQCGWINDPWGLSWQIVPKRFMELMADEDPKKVKAVVDTMMTMEKLIVADLERAYAGA
jgi:predicted 3-demethylubiquinone-9 3-methyltransferase (glyoxalase superfamily)